MATATTTCRPSPVPGAAGPVSRTESAVIARARSWPLAVVALTVVLLVVVACGPEEGIQESPTAVPVNSGIRGVVLLGPTCSDQPVDASPCLTPYAAAIIVSDADG